MTSKNDITGDEIKSKTSSDKYRDGWDRIFSQKKVKKVETLADYIAQVNQQEPIIDKNAPLR
tara:strand:+ start:386 stop:571 length:186 start_codon:yes stop_codon:yes gene_type:complete